ncbi:mandelate racemase/muconate lactonizing enzyme family protein [Zobellia roscoffensis]|uniref:mandelate racemase/muconate lactonizing enzyme family protein n=1 Tax=Zobellia roscoffensis TaxID=2779508 RepID=UPI00188BF65E|nr:mandelate racemase/muconate lactonizing enzyme family protein [Zobellia roscoffensis]
MKTNRRHFLKGISALGAIGTTYPLLSALGSINKAEYLNEKITKIELYKYDINIPRYFSFGTWYNRQHLFMKVSAGDYYGWSEIPASRNTPDINPINWVNYVKQYKGLSIENAQKLLEFQQLPESGTSLKEMEFIDVALLDISGKIQGKPAIELLNLPYRAAVPGLYCILYKNEEEVRKEAEKSLEENLAHHLKFKMYGDKKLDLKLLKTIRKVIGDNAQVISDVNGGYKDWDSLEELADTLKLFTAYGLDAIEDPANLKTHQWVQLQKMVGNLSLIPDKPLRPSWKGIKTISPGMGRIFNLHPSTMGSFKQTAVLAKKIKDFGGKIMIGDDSLVGPACSAWQQVAIGSGSEWVEAIEKKEDSKPYLDCILQSPTKKQSNGFYVLDPVPGFGLVLDEKRLKNVCSLYIDV